MLLLLLLLPCTLETKRCSFTLKSVGVRDPAQAQMPPPPTPPTQTPLFVVPGRGFAARLNIYHQELNDAENERAPHSRKTSRQPGGRRERRNDKGLAVHL